MNNQVIKVPLKYLEGYSQDELQSEMTSKFDAIFPSWTTLVATILALIILLIVLTKFLYKPMKKSYNDRKNFIQQNIDSATSLNEEARQAKEKSQKEIANAQLKAVQMLSDTESEIEKIRQNKIDLATQEAIIIIENAKRDIELEKRRFEEAKKQEIIEIALAAASKVVEKNVDSKTNRKIVEDFLNEKSIKKPVKKSKA